MGSHFRDYFSADAGAYAEFRPRYPDGLLEFLVARSPGRRLVWDCGTGSGQAAVGLASFFERVLATDASPAQIAHATAHPQITYRVAPAERSGLDPASVDLVTVAQALHWFDLPPFYQEVGRVLVPGGVLAVWCYSLVQVSPEIDRAIGRFYTETVGPFWAPGRRLVDTGYSTLPLPFPEISTPPFAIEATLSLDGLAGYVRTWSAVRAYIAAQDRDPLGPLIEEIAPHWGNLDTARAVRWPLYVRVAHKPG